jgi:hypothetical protein
MAFRGKRVRSHKRAIVMCVAEKCQNPGWEASSANWAYPPFLTIEILGLSSLTIDMPETF